MAMQTNTTKSLGRRFEDYSPSKGILIWACIATAIVTMVVGFSWGGWVTGGTSGKAVTAAAETARGDLASAICVERFNAAPDAAAKLVELKAITGSTARRQFVETGGWATMPGETTAGRRGAEGCVATLVA
jgi:hypothetical protein